MSNIQNLLLSKIKEMLNEKGSMVLAIEGRCGSGKSTLAATLSQEFNADIIRMDDFFLPPALRNRERYSQPGGNIHVERFIEELTPLLQNGKKGTYNIFSCSTGQLTANGHLEGHPLTIVEGVYCMHPELRHLYDLTLFLDIDPGLQKERLLRRDGEEALQMFINKWIPLEEAYFSHFDIPNLCDLRFSVQ